MMKKYRITDPRSGRVVVVSGNHAPTQEDAAAIIAKAIPQAAPAAAVRRPSWAGEPIPARPRGIIGQIGEAWAGREKRASEAIQRSADTYLADITGKRIIAPGERQTLTEGFAQAGGEAAMAVLDPIMVPLGMYAKKWLNRTLTPDERKMVAQKVTPIARALSEAIPGRVQRDVGALLNLSAVVPAGIGAGIAADIGATATVGIGKALKQEAGNIMQRSITPRPSIVRKERLDPKALLEYGVVGGKMKATNAKIEALFQKTENNIQGMLKSAQEAAPETRINKESAIAKFKSEVVNKEHPDLATRENAALKYADDLSEALDDYIKPGEYGDMTLEQANRAKRFIGKKAFKKGAVPTIDTQTQEYVWDQVYFNLMKELEIKVPGIREQNQVFAKLKSWKEEIEYRMEGPAKSKLPFPFSLAEIGAGGTAAIATGAITHGDPFVAIPAYLAGATAVEATHSPLAAKALYGLGKTLEGGRSQKPLSSITGRIGARLKSQSGAVGTGVNPQRTVYHGTNENFAEFDPMKASEYNEHGTAFYFSDSPKGAKKYGSRIIERPLPEGKILDGDAKMPQDMMNNLAKKWGASSEELKRAKTAQTADISVQELGSKKFKDSTERENSFNKFLDENGYHARSYTEEDGSKSFVVWNPKKSNTGAVGAGVNPQVHTPEFKTWFGDWQKTPEKASKVVDAEGKPLVVYHGTPEDFSNGQFDISMLGDNTGARSAKEGIFLTDDMRTASMYKDFGSSKGERTQAELYKKMMKLQEAKHETPKHFAEMGGDKAIQDLNSEFVKIAKGEYSRKAPPAVLELYVDIRKPKHLYSYDQGKLADEISAAKKEGYDGLILHNQFDGPVTDKINGSTNYVVFKPTQIKSATGNSGKFSPTNPDIRGSGAVPLLTGTAAGGTGLITAEELLRRRKTKSLSSVIRRK